MPLSEDDLQMALFKWAGTMEGQYPELKWLHAIPNGGRRDGETASKLKATGVKAGICDIALDVARGGFFGFKLELKRPNSSEKPSKEQAEYIEFCREEGYFVEWTNSFDEAKRLIIDYITLGATCQHQ